jgi:hypothetical protein
MMKVVRMMVIIPHVLVEEPHKMAKALHILTEAPLEKTSHHLRQFWLSIRNKGIRLEQTNHKIYSYGSLRPPPLKGVITTNISTDSKYLSAQFHVVMGTLEIC